MMLTANDSRSPTICFLLSLSVSQSSCLVEPVHSPPEDNQPLVTQHIKEVLRDDYNYDSTVRFFTLPELPLAD